MSGTTTRHISHAVGYVGPSSTPFPKSTGRAPNDDCSTGWLTRVTGASARETHAKKRPVSGSSATRARRPPRPALSWMAAVNKRASTDLDGESDGGGGAGNGGYMTPAAPAKTKGGWLAFAAASGMLGAPDAVDAAEALRKDRGWVAPLPSR